MSKFREHDIGYIIERMDRVADLLSDVYKVYDETGDIEEEDHKLTSAMGMVMLVNERLKKMTE